MANQTNDKIRLRHVTTKAAVFYGSEKWMPQKNGSGKNEILKGVMSINSTGQAK